MTTYRLDIIAYICHFNKFTLCFYHKENLY